MVKQVTNERLEHLWGKALTIASKKYRGWLFEALQGIKAERSTVVELEADRDSWKHKACANGWKTEFERAEAAEAQLTALPKWAQSSESKGQFYRKSIQEMAALREQLNALQEGLEGLVEIWKENEKQARWDEDRFIGAQCADHVEMLLKKTTPTVNSEGEG